MYRQMPPSPTEWVIIHQYSHRIRELSVESPSLFSMFFLQATSLHPSLLVPNLRALNWYPRILPLTLSALSILSIQRLLSPSLVSLNVTLSNLDDVTFQSFLANHPFLCPNLTSFDLNINRHEEVSRTIIEVLSRAIVRHEHLECLGISIPIDDVALTHIAMFPKLKELALVLHPDKSKLHQVPIPSDTTPFRNIECLTLEVWDLSFVMTLLRSQDQVFRSFMLYCHCPRPAPEVVNALFTALASRQRTRSLRSITLIPADFDVSWPRFPAAGLDPLATDNHLTHDVFRPLTSLCHLRKLVVELGHWFSIDDDDLLSLTRNWPLLEILYLNCQKYVHAHPWRSAKYVTFKGLLSLLECCPNLDQLCLPLDAREVPVNTGDVICNPALTHIYLPNSPINDPGSVGEILARHFPSVSELTWSFTPSRSPGSEDGPDVKTYSKLWTKVDRFLQDRHLPHDNDPAS